MTYIIVFLIAVVLVCGIILNRTYNRKIKRDTASVLVQNLTQATRDLNNWIKENPYEHPDHPHHQELLRICAGAKILFEIKCGKDIPTHRLKREQKQLEEMLEQIH